jgi:hypothetical protein
MYEKMIAAIVRKTQERMEEIDKSSITEYQMLFSEERAKTELETLRKDAERYRWLRAQGGWPESEAAMMGAKPEDFDSMIDDQMSYAREIGRSGGKQHKGEHMTEQPTALRLADQLIAYLGGNTAAQAAAELRRLHALNGELGAALRRLISYCNTLENRLMEADGEHPAVQEAKEAWAKVEGKV